MTAPTSIEWRPACDFYATQGTAGILLLTFSTFPDALRGAALLIEAGLASWSRGEWTIDFADDPPMIALDTKVATTVDDARTRFAEHTEKVRALFGGQAPRCPDCGGDLGGHEVGRIEDHRRGCPRFPL